ncbi:MAG TPA: glycosyltransferase [Paracoccaceae bacterium]|nr:glycosyltransferase [Paracoccaceae bacterium]
MICLTPADQSPALLDACLNLARQMSAAGQVVRLDAALVPADLTRGQKYETAVFAADPLAGPPVSHILVLGAERIVPDTVDRLRGLTRAKLHASVVAVGRFAEPGSRIAVKTKIAYATGTEPVVIDLDDLCGPPVLAGCATPALCPPVLPAPRTAAATTLVVHASAERLSESGMIHALSVLRLQPDLRLIVLPETGERDRLKEATAGQLSATDPGEISPEGIAKLADVVAFFDAPAGDERLAGLIISAIAQGKPVLDCTEARSLCATGAPVLSGPDEPGALWPYLERTVLPNLDDISRFITTNPWLERHALHRFLLAAGIADAPAAARQPADVPTRRTVFLPTNGVGLGHAQRAVLIAGAMTQGPVTFAAFPSCVPLVQDHGFDCLPLVQKSPDHADPYANDILNYRRLTLNMTPNDLLVFDGGFLFESISRIIAEKGLRAVWIRRGLWQASQLEHLRRQHRGREALFRRIIQPQEAFDELNEPVIYGSPVRAVGPVVQDAPLSTDEKLKVRTDLAHRFGRGFHELVVTMLGAGQAADRSAQTQALCGLFERRPDCLHLIVTWPGATIPPGLYGWRNTRVVQTRRALHLAQAADMAVSAAGYNSFHEFLYHGVPALFIPQMSPFMDDQRRRAQAAARRDLAGAVEPEELLRLSREVRAFLDDGKAASIRDRLAGYDLPQRGTAAAAALIEAEGKA